MKILFIVIISIFFIGCNETETVYINETPVANDKVKSNYNKPKINHKKRSYHKKTKTYGNNNSKIQKPYFVLGKWYYPISTYKGQTFRGIASWYGPNFHGKLTASGEIYNMYHYTAANKILPLGTRVKVINLNNYKSVIVKINDRGPFVKGRIIDLSYIAGKKIGINKTGTAPVKLIVLSTPNNSKTKIYHKNLSKSKQKNGKIKIQIGAFNSYKGAEVRKKRYEGFNTYIIHKNGKYKVYIGHFKTRKEAEYFKRKYRINGFTTTN